MKRDGLKFFPAAAKIGCPLGDEPPEWWGHKKANRGTTFRPKPAPSCPEERWQERAEKLLKFSQKRLWDQKQDILQWLRDERGLTEETIVRFGLGWNEYDLYQSRDSWGLPNEVNSRTGKLKKVWIPAGLVYCS
jgi:hypothetical protein